MRLLLIDDDEEVAQRIASGLMPLGYEVITSTALHDLAETVRARRIDLIILDRLIDCRDTLDQIEAWRADGVNVPLLILSSMVGLRDRIDGLQAGADGYMTKPFDLEELDAKLRALLRMSDRHAAGNDPDLVTVKRLSLDRRRREARWEGRLIPLHPREFKLLEELALNAGATVSRATLLHRVWNLHFDPKTKLIESHVSRLRSKLGHAGIADAISAVRGSGYSLIIHD